MRAWAAILVVMAGCRAGRAPQSCSPAIHHTDGDARDLAAGERYRFLGASEDGGRVSVLVWYLGPGSGAPFVHLSVIDAGAATVAFHESAFLMSGSEADLPDLDRKLREKFSGDLIRLGVDIAPAPAPVAWCADAGGRVHIAGDPAEYELVAANEPCPDRPGGSHPVAKLCPIGEGAGRCLTTPADTWGCSGEGQATLLDVVRASGRAWAVIDLLVRPFGGAEYHLVTWAAAP